MAMLHLGLPDYDWNKVHAATIPSSRVETIATAENAGRDNNTRTAYRMFRTCRLCTALLGLGAWGLGIGVNGDWCDALHQSRRIRNP